MGAMTRRDTLKMTGLALPLAASRALATEAVPDKKYLILSCDGGGIRGLLTAKIIERLNNEVPFLDQVDLFAGTSTGGIIALGLADKVTPSALVGLYRDRGRALLRKGGPRPPTAGRITDWLAALEEKKQAFLHNFEFHPLDIIHPKYPNEGLSDELTKIFGGRTFDDLRSRKSALVTTLRLSSDDRSWAPLVLHNLGKEEATRNTKVQDGPARSTKLVDAALCTSAAPLYFPPHEHPRFGYCVDGGLFANCPATIALGLALRANPGTFDEIRILSIGTGAQTNGIDIRRSSPFTKPSDYGALAWLDPISRGEKVSIDEKMTPAFPLLSALFDASSASHNYVCMLAMPGQYLRVQANLTRPIALDDTTDDALGFLEKAADSIPAAQWASTTNWLKEQLA